MNILVVLNYNDYETTEQYLKIIKNYNILDKIIVVDNCSTDNSYEILKAYKNKKIDVIKSKENKGYAYGNNYGVKYAENKYTPKNIIISNPDIEIAESTIENLCNVLNSKENIAAITSVIYDAQNRIVPHYAWKLPQYRHVLINCSIILRKIVNSGKHKMEFYGTDVLQKQDVISVDALLGCFFIIKASVLREIGYLDERTFLYEEENILAYKLKSKGYTSAVLCTEKLVHAESISINKNIKSWSKQRQILKKSISIYLKEYLKVSKSKLTIWKILFSIFSLEAYFIRYLHVKKVQRYQKQNGL